jgi:hypothetical protein
MSDWTQIRKYSDDSTVWSDGAGGLAFCDEGDLPQHASADVAGGSTAWDWLVWADDRQSAARPDHG